MADPIAASALIIAIFSGLTSLITTLHIRQCNAFCCKSDCSKSPPPTPSIPKS